MPAVKTGTVSWLLPIPYIPKEGIRRPQKQEAGFSKGSHLRGEETVAP